MDATEKPEESGYVLVCLDENCKDEDVELPAEADGTMLVSVLQSQYTGATGLKYRNPVTGTWRAVKVVDGILCPPDKGWGPTRYVVVHAPAKPPLQTPEGAVEGGEMEGRVEEKGGELGYEGADFPTVGYSTDGYKRKLEDSEGQRASKNPRSSSPDNYPKTASPAPYGGGGAGGGNSYRNQEDLIILGLGWTVTDQELKEYFGQFGEVAHCEVKKDMQTGKSRGFGFVRYGDRGVQASVFEGSHVIKGRRVELKYPKQSASHLPNKLFIGCLPLKPESTTQELSEYFSQFGRLSDVYIPKPYRGFGFVTFTDPVVAQKVVNMQHTVRKSNLNVSFADPKGAGSRGPQFTTDPYMSMGYAARMPGAGHQASPPRYQLQQQQQQPAAAYAVGYGAAQPMLALQRTEPQAQQNYAAVHAVPVSTDPSRGPAGAAAAGLYAVSYGNGTDPHHQQQPQQQSYAYQTTYR